MCDAIHPETGVNCDKDDPCWVVHVNDETGTIWDGVPLPDRPRRGASKRDIRVSLAEVKSRMRNP